MGRSKSNIKIVFFGTPQYVLPILKALYKSFKVVGIVTQKPKPAGRKKILTYSPVDKWAHERKLPIFYNSEELIKNKIDTKLGVLASYGAIIPKKVIDFFPCGILNAHPSLLPKFRGASPVQATIISREKQTGVSIIKLDEEVDHGPIISQFKEEVLTDDTTETLRQRLFERSAEVLSALIEPCIKGKITPRKQDHKAATYTKLITKQDAFIKPKNLKKALEGKSAEKIEAFIRAMNPWPIAWTYVQLNSKRLKILRAHLEGKKLALDEVQIEGKNPVSWKQFRQGYPNVTFE